MTSLSTLCLKGHVCGITDKPEVNLKVAEKYP